MAKAPFALDLLKPTLSLVWLARIGPMNERCGSPEGGQQFERVRNHYHVSAALHARR